MFVLTSPDKQGNRKIVNLAMFEGVMIEQTFGQYGLIAFTEYVADNQPRSILLVTFDEQVHANEALKELVISIDNGKVWDADNAKAIILEGGSTYF